MPDQPDSTAPGTSADTPPDAYSAVLRRTWATRFDDPAVPDALERVGRMMTDALQEADQWGTTHNLGIVRCGLAAVADDLESLANFLDREVANAPVEYTVDEHEVALCHGGATWRDRLLAMVAEIREEVES